ncbi:hypothetical protein CK219_28535 [Mesorhizobium sp. WSM4313]|nr:hypothetical protein CK219_28535 [Mesorhizobium sp. WSM4313]
MFRCLWNRIQVWKLRPLGERESRPMSDGNQTIPVVQRLVQETGIAEAQAHELALLIGLNWNSLMREAKLLQAGARAEVTQDRRPPRIDALATEFLS